MLAFHSRTANHGKLLPFYVFKPAHHSIWSGEGRFLNYCCDSVSVSNTSAAKHC